MQLIEPTLGRGLDGGWRVGNLQPSSLLLSSPCPSPTWLCLEVSPACRHTSRERVRSQKQDTSPGLATIYLFKYGVGRKPEGKLMGLSRQTFHAFCCLPALSGCCCTLMHLTHTPPPWLAARRKFSYGEGMGSLKKSPF